MFRAVVAGPQRSSSLPTAGPRVIYPLSPSVAIGLCPDLSAERGGWNDRVQVFLDICVAIAVVASGAVVGIVWVETLNGDILRSGSVTLAPSG